MSHLPQVALVTHPTTLVSSTQFVSSILARILKSSGERYKKIREAGVSLVGTGVDARTSGDNNKETKN